VAAALALAPLVEALAGVSGPRVVRLNLGPGDGPYVSGFAPEYEIEDGVATHWTSHDASLRLPLTLAGPALLRYRFARVLPERAALTLYRDGDPVDRLEARGGTPLERAAPLASALERPLDFALHVSAADDKGLGLRLDWLRVEAGAGARVRLRGAARFRAAGLVVLLFVLLRLSGWSRRAGAALAAPWALAATLGLARDPWLVHRLLTGLPEALGAVGCLGLLLASWARRSGRASPEAVRRLAALCAYAFLLRAAATNHPDFYYPDLMTHARLAQAVRAAGLDFFRSPARHLAELGAWSKPAYGGATGLPYSPAFHLPFALLGLSFDATLTAFKLTAAALTLVPLVLLWPLARRVGAAPLGALLMVLVPTYTSRLAVALLPSLLGHAADVLLLAWLAYRLERLAEPRVFATGVMLVAASQLAYVSGVTHTALIVCLLGSLTALSPRGLAPALRVFAMGAAGALISLLLFYRDFLGAAGGLAPRILGEHASLYPVQGFWALAAARTWTFFHAVYPLLAAIGLVRLLRHGRARLVVLAWLLSFALLILLRAKLPDVFRYGHETLFVTPLVCLAAGDALGRLWERGRSARFVAAAIVAYLAAEGFVLQWQAIAEQLANAT
jgi:hypothetical protein